MSRFVIAESYRNVETMHNINGWNYLRTYDSGYEKI